MSSVPSTPTEKQFEPAPKWPLYALLVWFVLLGFTDRGGGTDASSVEGRIALPDVFFVFLGPVLTWLAIKRGGFTIPRMGLAALAFIGWAFLFTPFSTNQYQSFFEDLVHGFAFFGFAATFAYLRTTDWEYRIKAGEYWLWGTAFIALLGVADFFLWALKGMTLFPGNNRGAVIGTFRNTGQAGAYYMMATTLAIPFYRIMSDKRKLLGAIAVFLIVAAGVLTVKRSTLAGIGVGLLLLPFFEPTMASFRRTMTVAGVFVGVAALVTLTALAAKPDIFGHFAFKFSAYSAEKGEEFAMENVRVIQEAIDQSPVFGVGLGGVWGVFGEHEVHSGYLGILTNMGFGGFFVYCWFLLEYTLAMFRPLNSHPQAKLFARIMLPIVIGMMVSWGYNYHFRKREFWANTAIQFVLLAPLTALAPRGSKESQPAYGISPATSQ